MQVPKHVMVAVDVEDNNHNHVDAGVWIARHGNSRITLLAIVDEREMNAPEAWEDKEHYDRRRARYWEWVESKLRRLCETIDVDGLDISAVVKSGVPYEEILGAAEELGTDLLVVRTHGRTGLQRFLMGSVASKVIEHAHCSVFVVR